MMPRASRTPRVSIEDRRRADGRVSQLGGVLLGGVLLLVALCRCGAPSDVVRGTDRSSRAGAGDRPRSSFQLVATRLPGAKDDVLVGTLEVPEDRDVVGGRTVPLHVVLVPARHPTSKRPPLFFVEGGPGAAACNMAESYLGDLSRFREERDVVLVDARGTGCSAALQMGSRTGSPLADEFTEMFPPDWVRARRAELEQRADLTCYTTEQVVADLEEVRAALGFEQIDLQGLSYGTRVVLGYLRRHADRVHAAILQGASPAGLHLPMHHAPAGQRALLALFAECAADSAASARFGDLASKLAAVLDRLRAAPAHVAFAERATGAPLDLVIRADLFAERLRSLLYSRETSQVVPLLVERAFEGSFETFVRLVAATASRAPSGRPPFADGFYLSVTCSEDVPFLALEEAERLARGTFFGDYRLQQQRRACTLWPAGRLPADFFEPVSVETPVLLLCGGLDPVTPAEISAEVASHLPNSRLVVVPRMGHVEDGLSNLDRFDRLLVDFLDRGTVVGLDPSFVATMLPGPFILDEAELPMLRD